MAEKRGLGMNAFFGNGARRRPDAAAPPPPPRVRTTVSLLAEDAEWLEMLRMRLRRRQGRGLTYGDVIGSAIRRMARDEGLLTDAS